MARISNKSDLRRKEKVERFYNKKKIILGKK